MPDRETMFEVLDENGATIGNVDLQAMRKETDNYIRVVEHLKQEVQQLRSQVQRCQTQMKIIETRISRR
jgi:predicted  nucleic acid-binding Zn-ribbon protein